MVTLIIGNKSDMDDKREVTQEEIDDFIKKYNFSYVEVSALSGENIKRCFEEISHLMMQEYETSQKRQRVKSKADNENISLNSGYEIKDVKEESKKGRCC